MFELYGSYEFKSMLNDDVSDIESIDENINDDIDDLLANRFDSLYLKDIYKKNNNKVEIIYPRIHYSSRKLLLKSPDYIKFLLSTYPFHDDLKIISKIVIRPRHILQGNVELMALFLHQKDVLVLYLHHPHFYSVKASKFARYAELSPAVVENIKKQYININYGNDLIPPLWYILSVLEPSDKNKIEKFLLKINTESKVLPILDEISFYYLRHGY